jgi:hypothetical protein
MRFRERDFIKLSIYSYYYLIVTLTTNNYLLFGTIISIVLRQINKLPKGGNRS